jgi:glycerophosphoryl diester phosphodiesterase
MPRAAWIVSSLLALVMATAAAPGAQGPSRMTKLAIAHRGASAYAPEHTLASYRLAIEQKADYVEQDLAVTRDGALICLHDDGLERTTNVEEVFPDRASTDPVTGRKQWLAVDFTLAEIKRLDAGSWFDARFAGERVPTWEEAIATVGTAAGLYPELKSPPLYRARAIDMTGLFLKSLKRAGLEQAPAHRLVVQSFDAQTLREVTKALPSLARTFLIEARDGPRWLSAPAFAEIAHFATDIGPTKRLLEGRPELVQAAHKAGLTVTPYTFTSRAASRFPDVRDEMHHYLFDLGVDALFTDNPDRFPRGGL